MAGLTNVGAIAALKMLLHANSGQAASSAIYAALATACSSIETSTFASGITECADTNYARQAVTFLDKDGDAGDPSVSTGSTLKTANSATITFPAFAAGGIAITHIILTTGATAGTISDPVYASIPLSDTKYSNIGETMTISKGDLAVTLD